jgi:Zn-dependent peptidase ImmA (M78 family)
VQRLQTATKSIDSLTSDEILETLLVEAGTARELPTNEKKLLGFLGLEQLSFDFMHELTFLETPEKPDGELRAALHMGERVIATQTGMAEQRKRFSTFHEIAHCVLPEHQLKLFVDTDKTLSMWTKIRLEREANKFAADLLFQGRVFTEQALSFDTSLNTVLSLAPKYGASYEATLRRFAETHVLPCAVIVYNKVGQNDESYVEDDEYRIQYTISSASFRKLYFSGGVRMAAETCKAADIYSPHEFWSVGRNAEKELVVSSHDKERWRFETEVFSNGYKIFQFLKRPVKPPAG